MKKYLHLTLNRIVLFASCLYGFQVFSQPPITCDNDPATPLPPCPPDEDIPINENISILIIIAILFGIYIIYKHQLNKKRLA